MDESRQRVLARPDGAARGIGRLHDRDLHAGLSEADRADQSIVTGADDERPSRAHSQRIRNVTRLPCPVFSRWPARSAARSNTK